MPNYLIYSVEDDAEISHIINLTLQKQGYQVASFPTGEDFLKEFKKKKPNMVLLDMMLPGIQGKDILREIRSDASNNNISIIIVSAKSLAIDKVDGLDEGADDYISKPFDLMEFMSRVNAQARRTIARKVVVSGSFTYDFDNRTLKKGETLISLTPAENKVISVLFANKGSIVEKKTIADELYGSDNSPEKLKKEWRTIDMYIKSLRQKCGDSSHSFITTVFNRGYKVEQ
jgi:two-component system alkaline phosphatase synthesis response regulator PhoP